MQTNCPQCSNRLVLDDAKVPATPFMLKCPKCQATVKLPGKPAASAASPPPTPTPPPAQVAAPPPPPATAPAPQTPPAPASAPPPTQAPMPAVQSGSAGKALVSLPDGKQASAVDTVLTRLGFAVEHLDAGDEKVLRLQQGDFTLVAAGRNGVSEERNIYRRVQMLPIEIRRRIFLMLVGDEFQTGEGTQAFAVLADLVLQPKDVAQSDRLVAQSLGERRRIYQTFWDAEDKRAEGKL